MDAPDSVLKQIQALLQLASRNDNENEAAAAASKANELLERYNLTADSLSGREFGDRARERQAVEGGFYRYQRYVWSDVASLNFCLHWVGKKRLAAGYRVNVHNLVGRKVNVAATKAMAGYLIQATDRLARERVAGNGEALASEWATSYRLGVAHRICEKLNARRRDRLAQERRDREIAAARAADAPTSGAVSLSVYIDAETDANHDFLYGEGWSARRAADAAKARAEREAYTRWAAEHPEEAAAKAREARRGRGSRGGTSSRKTIADRNAYWAGYDDGANVSIDRQVDEPRVTGLLR